MPRLYIISGCNGSGKTTSSYSLLPEMLECRQWVNSDEFAKSLSPFNPSVASVRASRFMLMKINYLLAREETFGVETTLATRTLLHTVRRAQEAGYEVTVLYFWLRSPALAVERVRSRVEAGGHDIPNDIVKRRYYMGLEYFFNCYMPVCDHWILADNSSSPFKVIAQGGKNENTLIRDQGKYGIVRTLALHTWKLGEENCEISENSAME